jgi:putative DNA primase/helicase
MTDLPDIRVQAKDRWPSLLPLLGVGVKHLTGKHGPCPMCAGKDRFRFDNKEGKGTYFCSGCGAGDGVKLVMLANKWDFRTAAKEIRSHLGEAKPGANKRELSAETCERMVRKLWEGAMPIAADDEAGAYLASRGFAWPYSSALRFAAQAPVSGHPNRFHLPALIARIRDADGKFVSVHRTFLEGGQKARTVEARQLMPGTLPAGCAIRLARPKDGILGVAEGLETALAVMRDFLIPCWSTINSTLLEKFVPPAGLKELHIFADNDLKYGGQKAGYALAHRLATRPEAPFVAVKLPPEAGTDWDDEGKRRNRAA